MKVLITGGSGFVGRHIVRELRRRDHDVVVLSRSGIAPEPGCAPLRADLTDELPDREMHAEVFVHCAAYVGQDPEIAHSVNVEGTRNLLAAAASVGAGIVSLSTLSVYGSGPHAGAAEGDLDVQPESVASRTRAEAEQLVLEYGGTVLRTALTYGAGDRWLVPSTSKAISALGVPDEFREVRTSIISASAMARAVAGCATRSGQRQTFHLAHPDPANLVTAAERLTALAARSATLDRFEAEAGRLGFSSHQLNLLRMDHWYDSRAIWEFTGEHPGPVIDTDPAVVESYRRKP